MITVTSEVLDIAHHLRLKTQIDLWSGFTFIFRWNEEMETSSFYWGCQSRFSSFPFPPEDGGITSL